MKQLLLGGIRSGKSRLAEQLATNTELDVVYIATATAGDEAMQQRIQQHRQRRPADWALVEEPLYLARVLRTHARPERCLLVDCLTLWLTNLLLHPQASVLQQQLDELPDCLEALPGDIIFVSNETGLGIVPLGELNRRFCDEAGQLHQQLAQQCDRVILTVAGLPHILKGDPL